MKCPKCKKAELKENISYKGVFSKRKVYTFFCPLCDYQNEKEIKVSVRDMQLEALSKLKGQEEANVEAQFGGFKIKSSGRKN